MNIKPIYTAFSSISILFSISGNVYGGDPHNEVIKLTSSEIRTYNQGDTINYKTTIAGQGVAMIGHLKQSIGQNITNPYGKNCKEHVVSTSFTGIGKPATINVQLLYFQDNQHSLYECGYYDTKASSYIFITDTSNTPDGIALSLESPMKVGNSTSNLITYTNGTWKDCTRAVQAIEAVNTTVGMYESFKINETCSNNADNSNTITQMWFVPNLYTIKESGMGDIIAADFVLDSFVFE